MIFSFARAEGKEEKDISFNVNLNDDQKRNILFFSISQWNGFWSSKLRKKSEIPVYCVIYTRTYVDCWILELKKKLNIKKMWNETNIWIQSTRLDSARLEIKSNVKYAIRCRCLWRFDSCFHAFTSIYRFIPIRLGFFALFLHWNSLHFQTFWRANRDVDLDRFHTAIDFIGMIFRMLRLFFNHERVHFGAVFEIKLGK